MSMHLKLKKKNYVYLFLRDRQSMRWGGAERERRHRIRSRLQALSCQHRARHGAPTHHLRDHDLNRSWRLNRLSHPGAPILFLFLWLQIFCFSWSSQNLLPFFPSACFQHPFPALHGEVTPSAAKHKSLRLWGSFLLQRTLPGASETLPALTGPSPDSDVLRVEHCFLDLPSFSWLTSTFTITWFLVITRERIRGRYIFWELPRLKIPFFYLHNWLMICLGRNSEWEKHPLLHFEGGITLLSPSFQDHCGKSEAVLVFAIWTIVFFSVWRFSSILLISD